MLTKNSSSVPALSVIPQESVLTSGSMSYFRIPLPSSLGANSSRLLVHIMVKETTTTRYYSYDYLTLYMREGLMPTTSVYSFTMRMQSPYPQPYIFTIPMSSTMFANGMFVGVLDSGYYRTSANISVR
jgi:hypothetical protein